VGERSLRVSRRHALAHSLRLAPPFPSQRMDDTAATLRAGATHGRPPLRHRMPTYDTSLMEPISESMNVPQ
jgi:hypothetical protein